MTWKIQAEVSKAGVQYVGRDLSDWYRFNREVNIV